MSNTVLQNGDFVWIWDETYYNQIRWGLVLNNLIILQDGGFFNVNDFNNELKSEPISILDGECHIGGIVRYATSFVSAQSFYRYWINKGKRFIDHNTKMCIIPIGETFISDIDEKNYKCAISMPLDISMADIEILTNRNIRIINNDPLWN